MSVRAVLFDLDGTLVDTMVSIPRAYADTVRDRGGPALTRDEVVAAWRLGPTAVVLGHLLGRPASGEDLAAFDGHLRVAASTARPFPGVPAVLDELRAAGYRLGVFTGAGRRAATALLAGAGLDGYFPVVVCGEDAAHPKPAPDGLLLACRRLDVQVGQAAYVGDRPVDRRCAEAAGVLAVGAGWGGATGWPCLVPSPRELPAMLRGC